MYKAYTNDAAAAEPRLPADFAYWLGGAAYLNEESQHCNPYARCGSFDLAKKRSWNAGWLAARSEKVC